MQGTGVKIIYIYIYKEHVVALLIYISHCVCVRGCVHVSRLILL
jgi:hypothetical protein